MDKRLLQTTVLGNRQLSGTAFELCLERPSGFEFVPGQRLRVHWGDNPRDYSIASSPAEDQLIICIRYFPQGRVTPGLSRLVPGEVLTMSGPHGHFSHQSTHASAVFVATGTGIAPFRAMVLTHCRPFLVLHGVAAAAERFYRDTFLRAHVPYTACLSGGEAPEDTDYAGRVTRYLSHRLPIGNYDFYLCGHREMIRDATHVIDERFEDARIFSEIFY